MLSRLTGAIRSLPETQTHDFFRPETVEQVRSGRNLESLVGADQAASFEARRAQNPEGPVKLPERGADGHPLNPSTSPFNPASLSCLGEDVFVTSYFANHGADHPGSSAELAACQPWLHWTGQSFEPRTDAQLALAQKMVRDHPGPVHLYRGLRQPFERDFFELTRALHDGRPGASLASQLESSVSAWRAQAPDSEDTRTTEQAFSKVEKELGQAPATQVEHDLCGALTQAYRALGRDAVFVTPDLATARKWQTQGVVELQLEPDRFLNLASTAQLYGGIELDSLEFSFVSPAAQEQLFSGGIVLSG